MALRDGTLGLTARARIFPLPAPPPLAAALTVALSDSLPLTGNGVPGGCCGESPRRGDGECPVGTNATTQRQNSWRSCGDFDFGGNSSAQPLPVPSRADAAVSAGALPAGGTRLQHPGETAGSSNGDEGDGCGVDDADDGEDEAAGELAPSELTIWRWRARAAALWAGVMEGVPHCHMGAEWVDWRADALRWMSLVQEMVGPSSTPAALRALVHILLRLPCVRTSSLADWPAWCHRSASRRTSACGGIATRTPPPPPRCHPQQSRGLPHPLACSRVGHR